MRTFVALALMAAIVCAAAGGTIQRIEKAETLDALEKVRTRAEPRIRRGYDDYRIVTALARAYARLERPGSGADLVARHQAKFEAGQIYMLRTLRIDLLAKAGRIDDAIRVATRQLGDAEAQSDVYHCHRRLGELHEAKKEWETALEHYSAELPRFRCGTCKSSLVTGRKLAIIRCWFHLGRVRPALDGLYEMMVATDAEGRVPTHTGRLFCEYSARAELLEEAAERIAKLGEKSRAGLEVFLAIAAAFADKDPAALVAVVDAPGDAGPRDEWTAKLLFELGEPAVELMEELVAAGSVPAYELCRHSANARLLAALEKRLEAEQDVKARRRLVWVLETLRKTAR